MAWMRVPGCTVSGPPSVVPFKVRPALTTGVSGPPALLSKGTGTGVSVVRFEWVEPMAPIRGSPAGPVGPRAPAAPRSPVAPPGPAEPAAPAGPAGPFVPGLPGSRRGRAGR